ncbi:MAG TPA: hypothetical protein VF269_06625 [Rhodanobacteraceae bacterium]
MKGTLCALVLGLGLVMAGGVHASTTHTLNDDVDIAAGQTAGDISTVNGDIHIGHDASVHKARTVNGDILLGAHGTAQMLAAVNGDVTLKADARVLAGAGTVNGTITLHHGANVNGKVSSVNGKIVLDAAHVGDGLEIVNGDITVGANSRVEGGITVKKPNDDWHPNAHTHIPRIIIGPHAVVAGTLDFERKVQLYVSDSARIGPVKGAVVHRFSGAQP